MTVNTWSDQDARERVQRDAAAERYRTHVNVGMARINDLLGGNIETRSAGNFVFDQTGRKYLDCGGYCVFFLGHGHPHVVGAVRRQLETHPLTSRVMLNDELGLAAEAIAAVAPRGLQYVWLASSGAEAVEAALKLARTRGCTHFIAAEGGYHGKTLGALSVTYNAKYREPFQPLLPNVTFVPFGDAGAIERALEESGAVTGVILEPIQSEAGVIIPPAGYLKDVESICRRHGAFLVIDEISTGLGRVGTWWGVERDDIVPDVLLAGKALSGGVMPVSAMIASAEAYQAWNKDPMLHTSTFAGNPLAAAAARAAVEVIRNENLVERSSRLGRLLLRAITDAVDESCPHLVAAVRGAGLLIGVEFKADHYAGDFLLELVENGVLVSHSLNAHNTVRFTPPAVLTNDEIEWLLDAVRRSARSIGMRHATPAGARK